MWQALARELGCLGASGCPARTRPLKGGAKLPLGRYILALFGKFSGQNRDFLGTKLRQIRHVPGANNPNLAHSVVACAQGRHFHLVGPA